MRRPMVAGNWKMNGDAGSARALASAVVAGVAGAACEVVLCPPHPYLSLVGESLGAASAALGAQNLSEHPAGAHTGEVSAEMLVDCGCTHVLVGHSERRADNGESSETVAAKFARALETGLVPVLCVGETLADREAGATEAVVGGQLDAVLERCGAGALARAVVAYEPVWAIGTGLTATPEQAQAVHRHLRERVAGREAEVAAGLRILYGGSVKAANAASLFAMDDIDGGLIGGAALDAAAFLAICRAAG